MSSVVRGDRRVHRRVEAGLRRLEQADQRRVAEAGQRVAERLCRRARARCDEVDLVAAEVEQVPVHHRQARLPAGLRGDAADQLAAQHQLRLARLASRATSTLRASRISATIRYGSARRVGVVGDCEQRLDHVRVADRPSLGARTMIERDGLEARQMPDRPGRCGLPLRHTTRVVRVSGTRCADLVLHLDLVRRRGRRCAGRVLLALASTSSLMIVEDLGRPAQDHGVVVLEDDRAALAQLVELALDAGADDADERA